MAPRISHANQRFPHKMADFAPAHASRERERSGHSLDLYDGSGFPGPRPRASGYQNAALLRRRLHRPPEGCGRRKKPPGRPFTCRGRAFSAAEIAADALTRCHRLRYRHFRNSGAPYDLRKRSREFLVSGYEPRVALGADVLRSRRSRERRRWCGRGGRFQRACGVRARGLCVRGRRRRCSCPRVRIRRVRGDSDPETLQMTRND